MVVVEFFFCFMRVIVIYDGSLSLGEINRNTGVNRLEANRLELNILCLGYRRSFDYAIKTM